VFPFENVLPFTPAIANTPGRILFNNFEWVESSGFYTAIGGERHLAIGNFFPDSLTTRVRRTLTSVDATDPTVYFYIDHVVVEPCAGRFPEQLIVSADTLLCPEANLTLQAKQLAGAFYTWEDGSNKLVRQVSAPGTYSLQIQLFGCVSEDSILIRPAEVPEAPQSTDTLLCPGEALRIALPDSSTTYTWEGRNLRDEWTLTESGTYTLEAAKGSCSVRSTIELMYELPLEERLPVDTTYCLEEGPPALIAAIPGAAYLWQNGTNARRLNSTGEGTYEVQVSTRCFDRTEAFRVQARSCACEALFQNAFTPNGDGYNDRFFPELQGGTSDISLHIMDRWGQILFRGNNPTQRWDGTYRGNPVAEGVYFWQLSYHCSEAGRETVVQQQGSLLLVR